MKDLAKRLEEIGALPDGDIDLGRAALYLSAASHEGRDIGRYENHLKKITQEIIARHKELLDAGGADDAETQLAALKHILADKHGYIGDSENYDHLDNADLMSVIDRAKGLPISLCILYMHAARAAGWNIDGLNIPGHFLARIEKDGRRVIFDPFYGAGIVEAPQLREIVKKTLGAGAELSSDYFEETSNRDILIRLQNNIKHRQIEAEDYRSALNTIENMLKIAPDEFRLLLDAGVLYSKTDQPMAAIQALQGYIDQVSNPDHRLEAEMLLRSVRESLN